MNNIKLLSIAINKIIEIKGTDCFKNATIFCAILDDLVPQLVTERKIFRRVINDKMLEELGELKNIEESKSDYSWSKIERKLKDEYGLREEWSHIITQSFLEAYKQNINGGSKKTGAENKCMKQKNSEILHYAEEDKQINIWAEYKEQSQELQGKEEIKVAVMGIGGAGLNFINRMENQFPGIDFIGVNTDKQELQLCRAQKLLLVGEKITLGLGTRAKYEIAEKAFEEDEHKIKVLLKGIDILFIICGIGGGTGAGGTPVVTNIAKQMGILTIAIVMKPFRFEVRMRHQNASHSFEQLKKSAGMVIAISNDVSLEVVDAKTTMPDALKMIDEVSCQTIKGIINSINYNSIKNISFEELRRIMTRGEVAYVGNGTAKGNDKIEEALDNALNSPWLEKLTYNVSKVFIHLSGNIMQSDIEKAKCYIQEQVGDINIIASACYEENKYNEVSIVLIVFEKDEKYNIKSSVKLNDFKLPDFLKKF